MKHSIFLKLATVALLAAVVATGCQTKTPKNVTPIYGAPTRVDDRAKLNPLTNAPTTEPLDGISRGFTNAPIVTPNGKQIIGEPLTPAIVPPGGGNAADPQEFEGMTMVREAFAANTVHFDYDKSIVKASEVGKLQPVIAALKSSPQNKLLIEGHCDERGTEEYNRALGERRALAIRERLAKAGISADRLRTVSYGEDRPAELGHTEAAWAKNRRGELVLLRPKN